MSLTLLSEAKFISLIYSKDRIWVPFGTIFLRNKIWYKLN